MATDQCCCRIIHQDRVERATKTIPPGAAIEQLALLFKAVADPTRLKMLMALEAGEMCVCDLAAFCAISESAVSHQLRMLRQLRLVANRREGPVLYYRLADHHVGQLIQVGLDHIRE